MLISDDQLEKLIPRATDRHRGRFLGSLNTAIEEFNITSSLRIAAFIAQIAYESYNLSYVEELDSGEAYEYRRDLGNLEPEALQIAHSLNKTTGRFYKGRGLIQLTGFYNYKKCGEALKLDLIHNPLLLTDPLQASRSSA